MMDLPLLQDTIDKKVCQKDGYGPEDVVLTGADMNDVYKDIRMSALAYNIDFSFCHSPAKVAVKEKNFFGFNKRVYATPDLEKAWMELMNAELKSQGYKTELVTATDLKIYGWSLECKDDRASEPPY